MYDSFLTIPDAPNYEINSQLVCRNKKTGHILKMLTDKFKKYSYYSLYATDAKRFLKRTPQYWRRQAVAATSKSRFQPVPSLGYRYEITPKGILRNVKTKITIKCHNGSFRVVDGQGKPVRIARWMLLWEVHGIILKRRYKHIPCFAENHHGKHYFPTMKACAQFLALKIFYSVKAIYAHLNNRENNICGWKITYVELVPNTKWNVQGLASDARRQKRLDDQLCKN